MRGLLAAALVAVGAISGSVGGDAHTELGCDDLGSPAGNARRENDVGPSPNGKGRTKSADVYYNPGTRARKRWKRARAAAQGHR